MVCHHTAFLPLRLFSCLTDYFGHLSFSLPHTLVSNGSLDSDSEMNTCLLPDIFEKLLLSTLENKPSMLLTLTGNEIPSMSVINVEGCKYYSYSSINITHNSLTHHYTMFV